MKSLNYYASKIVRIFIPECPKYSEGCYSWDNDDGSYPCGDTRGWLKDGTRCQQFQKKSLLSKLAGRIAEDLLRIGGLEE